MDRIHARFDRDANDVVRIEIGLHRRLALADEIRLVHLEAMQREAILLRVDRDTFYFEFRCRAHHTDGDFAAVGNQELFYLRRHGGWLSYWMTDGPDST